MSVSTTPAADEIERQMRDLRSDLREEVQEIVENARVMTDWHYYVRTYPWLCLGAAAALGYVLVPPRVQVVKPDAAMLADLVRQHHVAVNAEVKPRLAHGLVGSLVNMAAGAALQGVMTVASHQLNQLLQALASPPSPPSVSAPPSSSEGLDYEEPHR